MLKYTVLPISLTSTNRHLNLLTKTPVAHQNFQSVPIGNRQYYQVRSKRFNLTLYQLIFSITLIKESAIRKRRYLGRYFAHPMMQNRRAKRDDYKPSAVRVTQRCVP
ncbi:hypothetical protein [Piscirickettsia salmonis]|uniref:hypothetical protein n=1 Tax=Piscirickettsia salmonis TaxID=1238 RepID=UPI0012B875FA|nr:hypothetical protein [Piscirickettsia salmonis]